MELPVGGDTLEAVGAAVGEGEPRPGDQVLVERFHGPDHRQQPSWRRAWSNGGPKRMARVYATANGMEPPSAADDPHPPAEPGGLPSDGLVALQGLLEL